MSTLPGGKEKKGMDWLTNGAVVFGLLGTALEVPTMLGTTSPEPDVQQMLDGIERTGDYSLAFALLLVAVKALTMIKWAKKKAEETDEVEEGALPAGAH